MKKLVIVSTKAETGKGGISTALLGYIQGLNEAQIDFEIVESHSQEQNMFVSWFTAFWSVLLLSIKYRKKVVFWFHCGPWLSMLRKSTLAFIPRILGCETLGHIHSPTFFTYLNKGKLTKLLIKVLLSPYSKLVVLTPWWQNVLEAHKIDKTSIVSANPNNVNYCKIANQYLIEPRKINDSNKINIVTMARLVKGKGIEAVIGAMLRLPKSYCLTIAGDGPNYQEYKSLVKELKLDDRVTFKGWINGSQKEELLREADVFCLPSTYDSFGMVFIEAMAFDLPVIAYDWGPIKDVVTPEVGVCCSEPSIENVANSLIKVCNNLKRYSGKGPREVMQKYTPTIVAKNITKLLKFSDC